MLQIAAFSTKDVLHGGCLGASDGFAKATKPDTSQRVARLSRLARTYVAQSGAAHRQQAAITYACCASNRKPAINRRATQPKPAADSLHWSSAHTR